MCWYWPHSGVALRRVQMTEENKLGFGGECINPDWGNIGRVHDWRNYISQELAQIWQTLTDEQKILIAQNADEQASNEDWD